MFSLKAQRHAYRQRADRWRRQEVVLEVGLPGAVQLRVDAVDPELNGNGQSDFQDDFLTAPPIRTLAVRVSLGF